MPTVPMRLLASENISRTVILELRNRGHDVLSVKESMRAADDASVLARAQAEHRIVLTHDKGFGELAFRYGLSATCGVILVRLSGTSSEADNRRVLDAIGSPVEFRGHFSVLTGDRIRTRRLHSKAIRS